MLELDSPNWKSLSHAYGTAQDIPGLLEQLKTAAPPENFESEPWFSLWSSLCHQSDVYTASYAALPHIVAIVATKPVVERLHYLHFIACIEACRHRKKSPELPAFLKKDYHTALEQAARLALECLVETWEEKDLTVLLGAFAVFRGHAKLGNAMMELPEESSCPECGEAVPPLGYDLDE